MIRIIASGPTDFYASPNGSNTAACTQADPGNLWTRAIPLATFGFDYQDQPTPIIHLAPGTYAPPSPIAIGVPLLGGIHSHYSRVGSLIEIVGDDNAIENYILQCPLGNNNYHGVFEVFGGGAAYLHGVTLAGAYKSLGAVAYGIGSYLRLENIRLFNFYQSDPNFPNNPALNPTGQPFGAGYGGSIYVGDKIKVDSGGSTLFAMGPRGMCGLLNNANFIFNSALSYTYWLELEEVSTMGTYGVPPVMSGPAVGICGGVQAILSGNSVVDINATFPGNLGPQVEPGSIYR